MLRGVLVVLAGVLLVPVVGAEEPIARQTLPGEETRRAVISLLRDNRQTYGDDAAIMQGLLLVHANQAGAILATESTIVGFEERDRRKYVAFRVDSGAIFDDNTIRREERVALVWRDILERTLRRYPTFEVPGDGISVDIVYSHRPYSSLSELYGTLDDPRVFEHAKFYLLTRDLAEFLRQRLDPGELLARSVVLVDDEPVEIELPEIVGPPRPGGPEQPITFP